MKVKVSISGVSGASVSNTDLFLKMAYAFDTEMFKTIMLSHEYSIQWSVMSTICRALADLHNRSGYGKIEIYVASNKITGIEGTTRFKFDDPIIKIEEEQNGK